MISKKILIIPSWYSSAGASTSGSFFREQALLMDGSYDIKVWVSDKIWISKRRFFYNKFFRPNNRFGIKALEASPPEGNVILYPFCSGSSDEQNLEEEVSAFSFFLKKQSETGSFYPDLIHAHSVFKGGIIAHEIHKRLNIPYIITEHHGPFLLHRYSDFWKKKIIEALENAKFVLSVSEYQKQQILIHGINCNPINVGNLVDDDRFILHEKNEVRDKNKSTFNCLYVAYYPNFIKDFDTLVDTLKVIKNNNLDNIYHFTIVGGGELKGEYEPDYYQKRLSEIVYKKNNIRVIPVASREEMPVIMQQSDVLVSTSISESFGISICEAMLCGKPVISTRNGGIYEFSNSDNSILVPLKNPQAVFEALEFCRNNYSAYNPQLIRKQIVSRFGKAAFFNQMKKIYECAISE